MGRIAIAADPAVLATKPELDPLLEPGDVIYIPQRPSTVAVLGQVMQPGSLPYRAGNTLQDYIEMAGGYSPTSDESNTFIVLPDGSARKIETSWLNFSSVNLPPGTSIVIPRDVTPLDTRQLILDVTGIFSQLAVTAASLCSRCRQAVGPAALWENRWQRLTGLCTSGRITGGTSSWRTVWPRVLHSCYSSARTLR